MNTTYFLNMVATSAYKSIPLYLGLLVTTDSVVAEPVGGGYTRILINALSEPVDGVITTTTDLKFPETTADLGVANDYAIYDAVTDGNMLMSNTLEHRRVLDAKTVVLIKSGEVRLIVENPAKS